MGAVGIMFNSRNHQVVQLAIECTASFTNLASSTAHEDAAKHSPAARIAGGEGIFSLPPASSSCSELESLAQNGVGGHGTG